MILEIKREISTGVFEHRPLDLFEDFKIKYNHQYENYKTIGGKNIPYTNKFKVPLTLNNRTLLGIPNDLAYPVYEVINGKIQPFKGRAIYNDGSIAFEFFADIEGQVVNVLEPYIEVSIIDVISKALSDLGKWKMSDLMKEVGTTRRYVDTVTDTWIYGSGYETDTNLEHMFVFPYYNFNNKNSLFAFDPKRKLSQLQPTFVLNKLIDRIFNYVGVDIESNFLTLDNQLGTGIKANELGLMLPCELKTSDDYPITTNMSFAGRIGFDSTTTLDRVVGVPGAMPTSSRVTPSDFMLAGVENQVMKVNYDYLSDLIDSSLTDATQRNWCSMVDGKMTLKIESNSTANNPIVKLGLLTGDIQEAAVPFDIVGTNWPDLDVKIVFCDDMEQGSTYDNVTFTTNTWESGTTYDAKTAQKIGTASFINTTSTTRELQFQMAFDTETDIKFDVKANAQMKLALILAPKEGIPFKERYTAKDNLSPNGLYTIELEILDGYIKYSMITNLGNETDETFTKHGFSFSRPSGASQYPFRMTTSFDEPTDMPPGFPYGDTYYKLRKNINPAKIDMSETMKSFKDYSLLEVVKMVAERYNLELYSEGDGTNQTIHLDTSSNRVSSDTQIIDHLIDEGVDIEFTRNDNGIVNIKDSNPSFYEGDFNQLDKLVISEVKRDSVDINFKSSIVNSKMFEDIYDSSAYDLLRVIPDSNFWGTADRKQVKPKELKPAFTFLKTGDTPVYFPVNVCAISSYDLSLDPDAAQLPASFLNEFHNSGQNTLIETTNEHSSGFKLISFKDGTEPVGIINPNTLYRNTWYSSVQDQLNDESVIVSFDLYISETTVKKLLKFPSVFYKGQEWIYKGLNDYPLSSKDGGLTKVTLIKKKPWN